MGYANDYPNHRSLAIWKAARFEVLISTNGCVPRPAPNFRLLSKEPMFYVVRSADGAIQSVSREQQPGNEMLDEDAPEIQRFFNAPKSEPAFSEADADFVRVLEDLIDTLILKNIIQHTDLPPAAQRKMLIRKGLRNRLHGALNLLGSDDRIL